jgi:tetraacyldisaccharide 4'-kinase
MTVPALHGKGHSQLTPQFKSAYLASLGSPHREIGHVPRFAETFHAASRDNRPGLKHALIRGAGWWLSVPYAIGVRIRNRRFDRDPARSIRVPVPVISVGNLTLGGTGKTPAVEYFAKYLRSQGRLVAILSRGYGSEAGPNDEALLLEENLPDVPHLQGRDRAAIAHTAIEELESEVLLLDDGFQHRRLHRDFDIVLIDATRDIAAEYLFPRGLLREPVSSLKRAHAVIFTRCDQATPESVAKQTGALRTRFPHLLLATARHASIELIREGQEALEPAQLRDRKVLAFCGIGNPEAFRRTLSDLGAEVLAFRAFADHHAYTKVDVESLRTWAGDFPEGTDVLTTQKDWVKLRTPDLAGRPLFALRVGLTFDSGVAELLAKLDAVLPEPATE